MGKRSDFERLPRDYYPTPLEAVLPLKGLLPPITFVEPCAGDGRLVEHIERVIEGSLCLGSLDTEPQASWILQGDASHINSEFVEHSDMIITNPPYKWNLLKVLLDVWIPLRPTLLLLPADFMHNKRVKPYMDKCRWVKSIGRVKWIEGSKTAGVDNYAWYLFDNNKDVGEPTHFYGRN